MRAPPTPPLLFFSAGSSGWRRRGEGLGAASRLVYNPPLFASLLVLDAWSSSVWRSSPARRLRWLSFFASYFFLVVVFVIDLEVAGSKRSLNNLLDLARSEFLPLSLWDLGISSMLEDPLLSLPSLDPNKSPCVWLFQSLDFELQKFVLQRSVPARSCSPPPWSGRVSREQMQFYLAYCLASVSACSGDVLQFYLKHRSKAGLSYRSYLLAAAALLNLPFGGPHSGFWARSLVGNLDGEAWASGRWHPLVVRRMRIHHIFGAGSSFYLRILLWISWRPSTRMIRPRWWQPEQHFANSFGSGQRSWRSSMVVAVFFRRVASRVVRLDACVYTCLYVAAVR